MVVTVCLAVMEPILEADKAQDYFAIHVNPTLLQGLSALCKHKPAEPVVRPLLILRRRLVLFLPTIWNGPAHRTVGPMCVSVSGNEVFN